MFSRLKRDAEQAKKKALAETTKPDVVESKYAADLAASIVKSIGKKQDSALLEDDDEGVVGRFIPTGFPNLDDAFGGGWPVGRCSEIFGPEASAKSALADMAIAQVCKMGGMAQVEEFEGSRTPDRLTQLGADVHRVVMNYPDHAEQAWDHIWATYETAAKAQEKYKGKAPPILVLWDSLGSCAANAKELDGTEKRPGRMGEAMSRNLRRMYKRIRDVNMAIIFVNQIRAKIGGFGMGPQTDTTGGWAVKFAYTLRVQCRAWAVPQTGRKTGLRCLVRTVKNKIVQPWERTTWELDYTLGPSPALTALTLLRDTVPPYVKTSALGAGQLTCPLWKTFTRDKWVAKYAAEPEFAKQVWSVVKSFKIIARTGFEPEATGDE